MFVGPVRSAPIQVETKSNRMGNRKNASEHGDGAGRATRWQPRLSTSSMISLASPGGEVFVSELVC